MSLGENIYRLRTERNMSQGDLADALDVSRQSVSKWENDSAVPELEKLIKMSSLFCVTLDALVNSQIPPEQSSQTPKEPEKKAEETRSSVPAQLTLGLLLICTGVGGMFWFCLAALLTGHSVTLGLLIGVTLIACGILSFVAKHPYVYWGWCVWIGYLIYVFVLTPRWESEIFLLILACLFLLIQIIWTVISLREGLIHMPKWAQAIFLILLLALITLFIINVIPPSPGKITPVIPE